MEERKNKLMRWKSEGGDWNELQLMAEEIEGPPTIKMLWAMVSNPQMVQRMIEYKGLNYG